MKWNQKINHKFTNKEQKLFEVTSSLKISNWLQLAIEQIQIGKQQPKTSPNYNKSENEEGLLYHHLKIYQGKPTINFHDQKAVTSLTRCLLKVVFDIQWVLPLQNLCPRVPNRVNYLIWIHRYVISQKQYINLERMTSINVNNSQNIIGVDIGTGASLIYPLLGNKIFGWRFIGIDIDQKSIQHAQKLIQKNNLQKRIELRKSDSINALKDSINPEQKIDFVMCNPPFFDSSNLQEEPLSIMTQKQHNMLGGQYEFFFALYMESFYFSNIQSFTMMIGLGRNFYEIKAFLKEQYQHYGLLNWVKFGKINQSENSRFIVAWKVNHQKKGNSQVSQFQFSKQKSEIKKG